MDGQGFQNGNENENKNGNTFGNDYGTQPAEAELNPYGNFNPYLSDIGEGSSNTSNGYGDHSNSNPNPYSNMNNNMNNSTDSSGMGNGYGSYGNSNPNPNPYSNMNNNMNNSTDSSGMGNGYGSYGNSNPNPNPNPYSNMNNNMNNSTDSSGMGNGYGSYGNPTPNPYSNMDHGNGQPVNLKKEQPQSRENYQDSQGRYIDPVYGGGVNNYNTGTYNQNAYGQSGNYYNSNDINTNNNMYSDDGMEHKPKTPGNATAGMVMGILSIVCSTCCCCAGSALGTAGYIGILISNVLGIFLGIVGLILSIKGNKQQTTDAGTAGVICSIIGLIIGGILLMCVICVLAFAVQTVDLF